MSSLGSWDFEIFSPTPLDVNIHLISTASRKERRLLELHYTGCNCNCEVLNNKLWMSDRIYSIWVKQLENHQFSQALQDKFILGRTDVMGLCIFMRQASLAFCSTPMIILPSSWTFRFITKYLLACRSTDHCLSSKNWRRMWLCSKRTCSTMFLTSSPASGLLQCAV